MKKALVYNKYLHTAGGGERLTLDWCLALYELGYEITLITSSTFTRTIESLCDVFGISGGDRWNLKITDTEEEIEQFCRKSAFDLFVNGTFCSSMANPAPIGLYALMFPQSITPIARQNLLSYQHVLVISEFSEIYTRLWWGEDFPVHTLPPPISNSHMNAEGIAFGSKEKIILNVGRFNIDGHCKRQLDAIQTFQELLRDRRISSDWRLYSVGNLNSGEENQKYLVSCLQAAGPNVHIETDVPFERLQQLYRTASVLWQFTGIHLSSGQSPGHCEHLGLVAMDSMCYGTLPMVYQRSGVGYIIDHGKTGFAFDSIHELKNIMMIVDDAFGTKAHEEMFAATRAFSKNLGFESFKTSLASYLSETAQ